MFIYIDTDCVCLLLGRFKDSLMLRSLSIRSNIFLLGLMITVIPPPTLIEMTVAS